MYRPPRGPLGTKRLLNTVLAVPPFMRMRATFVWKQKLYQTHFLITEELLAFYHNHPRTTMKIVADTVPTQLSPSLFPASNCVLDPGCSFHFLF